MSAKREQVVGRPSTMNGGALGEKMGIEFIEATSQLSLIHI